MVIHTSIPGPWRIALAVATLIACSGGNSNDAKPDARPAAFRDANIYDAPLQQILPDCPASCDDQNPCTKDACDAETHLCINEPATDGTACAANDLCSIEAVCKSGLCIGTRTKDCKLPPDQCHMEGYCVPATGVCTYPNVTDYTTCDDGDLCTTGDQCIGGVCQAAPIQCGAGASCDRKTGQCPGFPSPIWGFVLDPSAATALSPSFSDLEVSPSGALYFALTFASSLDLGAGLMSSTSSVTTLNYDFNAAVARLDPSSGKALWSRSWGDKSNQYGSSIAINAGETVLVSGVYLGTIDLGPVQGIDAGSVAFTNTGTSPRVFLVALDGGSGAVIWAKSIDVSASTNILSAHTKVIVDPQDNNFVLCATPSKMVSDLGSTTAGGKGDALVAKLSALSGKVLWIKQFGSAADESCDAVAADGNGKLYITGKLSKGSAFDLGNGISPLAGPGGALQKAVYVAQLDGKDGTVKWGTSFYNQGTTTGDIAATALASDGTSVWLGGSFSYSVEFGSRVLTTYANTAGADAGGGDTASRSAFLLSLDVLSGKPGWAQRWGGDAQVYALASTSSGSLIIGGNYTSEMVFDTGALANPKGAAVPFVAKLDATTGRTQAARGYVSSSSAASWFLSIAVDQSKAATLRDSSYAIGVLALDLDLGAPVGQLPAAGSSYKVGPGSMTLLVAKFSP